MNATQHANKMRYWANHYGGIVAADLTAAAVALESKVAALDALRALADEADWIDLQVLQKDPRGYRLLKQVQAARAALAKAEA